MDRLTLIGSAASVLTAVCMLPQLIRIMRNKCANDISYMMLGVLITGVGLWAVYGIMKGDLFIISSNAFSFLVNCIILVLSIKYRSSTNNT
jgi:MtN3 and saliva related transmembrane protein